MLNQILVLEWLKPVLTVNPYIQVRDVAKQMKAVGTRQAVVVRKGQPIGILTYSDIQRALPSDEVSLSIWEATSTWSRLTAERIMTRRLVTIESNRSIQDAIDIMEENSIHSLPVVDFQGKILGIVSESDIFKQMVKLCNTLEEKANHV